MTASYDPDRLRSWCPLHRAAVETGGSAPPSAAPAAAPFAAKPPLLPVRGAQMETAAGWRCSGQERGAS